MNKRKSSIPYIGLLLALVLLAMSSCSDQLMELIEDKVYFDEHGYYPFKNTVYKKAALFYGDDCRNYASAAFSDNSVLIVYQDYPSSINGGRVIIGDDGSVRRSAGVFSFDSQCESYEAIAMSDGRAAAIYHHFNDGNYYICVFQSDGTIDQHFAIYATSYHEYDTSPVLLSLPDGNLFFIGLEDTPRGIKAARISTDTWTVETPYMIVTSDDVSGIKDALVMPDGRILLAYGAGVSGLLYRFIDPDDQSVSSAASLDDTLGAEVSSVLRLSDGRIMFFVNNEFQVWKSDMSSRIATRQFDGISTTGVSAAPTLDGGAVVVYRVFDDGSRPRYRYIDSNLDMSSAAILHQEDCYWTAASLRPDGKVLIAYSYNTSGDHRGYYLILE